MRCPRPHVFETQPASSGDDPYTPDQLYIRKPFDQCIPTAKWRNGQLNYRSSRSSFRKVIMQCYDITLFMDHSPKRYVIQPLVTLNTMGGKPVQRGSNLVQGWVQFVIAKLPSHANGNRWWSHPFLFLQKCLISTSQTPSTKIPSCNILQDVSLWNQWDPTEFGHVGLSASPCEVHGPLSWRVSLRQCFWSLVMLGPTKCCSSQVVINETMS